MEQERWEQLKSLFAELVERPAGVRDAWLRETCAGDAELEAELRSLLAEYDSAPEFLSTPALDLREAASRDLPPRFAPGRLLARRFRIGRFIARGGMGEVYEAEDLELGDRVALKTIRQDVAADERTLGLFKQEIQSARRVTHPNVCRIFDLGQHTEAGENGSAFTVHFLTMEYLEGETLSHRLKRSGPFSPEDALPLIGQMAAALEAAHAAGLIHRDFKPANVMLVPQAQAGGLRAVVTDFGIALPALLPPDGRGTPAGPLAGTPAYMAPEQASGDPVTTAADIYSLGLVVAEMVGGSIESLKEPGDGPAVPPAPSAGPKRVRLPRECRTWQPVIERCLEPRPERRFASPLEVARAFEPSRKRRTALYRGSRLAVIAALLTLALLLQMLLPDRLQLQNLLRDGLPPGGGGAAQALSFQERDWVLVTRFDNRTGEAVLDGSIEYALERELSNSRFVNVVPGDRVSDALSLMKAPLDTPVTVPVGREICRRDGAIRALLAGRVEKLGRTYQLSLLVLDPVTGSAVASIRETAADQDGVLEAIRRLSDWARLNLGEALAEIEKTGEELEKVTTPSLEALQAYSQADRLIIVGDPEPLLRQALAADPSFASAENLLGWALKNAGRSAEEFMPHFLRARELAAGCSPRERYFIEASYGGASGDEEKAKATYEALLGAFPDHYWAANNLAVYHLNRLQQDEALPFVMRAADLRPARRDFNILSAILLVQRRGEVGRAAEYAARVARGGVGAVWEYSEDWCLVFPAHRAWVEGNVEQAQAELVRLSGFLATRQGIEKHRLASAIGLGYLTLGEFQRADECFRNLLAVMPEGNPPWEPIIAAMAAEDPREFRGRVDRILRKPEKGIFRRIDQNTAEAVYEFPMTLLVQAGYVSEAEKILREGGDRFSGPAWDFVRGEVALSRRNFAGSAERFQRALGYRETVPWYEMSYLDSYFMGAASMAKALERLDRTAEAIQVLEEASARKAAASFPGTLTWGINWLKVRARLAEFYRRADRTEDAIRVEDELLGLLALADAGHPIVTRIRAARGASPQG